MSNTPFTLSFQAELKQVDNKKLASGDWGHKVVLHTDDPIVNNLLVLSPETLLNVTVEVAL